VRVAPSLADAVEQLRGGPEAAEIDRIFVIGGAAAFAEALGATDSGVYCDTVHVTRVFTPVECDTHIPQVDDAKYALVDFKVRCLPSARA
jgi:dihydrofolate reductase